MVEDLPSGVQVISKLMPLIAFLDLFTMTVAVSASAYTRPVLERKYLVSTEADKNTLRTDMEGYRTVGRARSFG